ncbi:hypothetical protein [Schaalia georgiae]|uniref:hypothetical protein n=1 Tax=Schaalia georgiae TaxID=52768 RepID=UPI0004259DAD|nr:hypothetical protein [Schaalia georgiae]
MRLHRCGGGSGGFAVACVEAEAVRARELGERAGRFVEAAAGVRGVGADERGQVRVVVDHTGMVVEARVLGSRELGDALVRAYAAARAGAGRALADAAGEAYGPESAAARSLAGRYGSRRGQQAHEWRQDLAEHGAGAVEWMRG